MRGDTTEAEDSADIFDIALPSLFNLAPIAFSTPTPTSLHTYQPPPPHSPIQLRLPNPSAEVYTKLQANHLWLSAIYLADLIHRGSITVDGRRIAELGAAAGLPGVSACKLGASVVGTDWGDDGILDALRDNFGRACPASQWAVRGHEWGTDVTPLLRALPQPDSAPENASTSSQATHSADVADLNEGRSDETNAGGQAGDESGSESPDSPERFDALLLADTLWVTEAHSALLDSIFALLKPDGTAHIAAGLHTGRGPLQRFISAAEARGGVVRNHKEVFWKAEGEWEEGASGLGGLEEERGVVVYFELVVPAH